VLIRRGRSQGSGTIIASVDGETLVLTAAHVVHHKGPIVVELHRYNLGLEKTVTAPGPWPRLVRAELLAADKASDLAVLRIVKLRALPYVARLAREHANPPADSTVSSIGIDLGTNLTGWSTRLVETVSFELNGHREQRPFLITEKIPEHGRSGGGLYLPNGELVGVCIGHSELVRGKEMGVFASREAIRILLVDRKLSAVIARSESRRARSKGRSPQVTAAAHTPSKSIASSGLSGEVGRARTGTPTGFTLGSK
jgi:S1-C subfamily serine protease